VATYAIGDVQGCYDELVQLLAGIGFSAERDRLWFVGDLVNRGPQSLAVLRFVRSLGERAVVVLGNHDLHLVALHEGFGRERKDDTLDEVLCAADRAELIDWLRLRPMMYVQGDYAMVHAALLPQWSIPKALGLAGEVEQALAGPNYREFLKNLYGSKPDAWDDDLQGWDRLRVIVNVMTRLRFCTKSGRMDFQAKGLVAPPGYEPWFEARKPGRHTIVCGHWSALGLKMASGVAAIDSGCVWGGSLTALRLEDRRVYQMKCGAHQAPGGEHD
jgi:bis(5'-nucleosyl)-tetraphosphatase (symmetrical)